MTTEAERECREAAEVVASRLAFRDSRPRAMDYKWAREIVAAALLAQRKAGKVEGVKVAAGVVSGIEQGVGPISQRLMEHARQLAEREGGE